MSTDPVSISVIVPAYNAEKFLPDCLNGLSRSASSPLEIIVVDDGSTDKTAEIAANAGARVITTAQSQSGPGAARNAAAQIALGNVLLFVDADVVVQPDTVGRFREHFLRSPELGAVFGSYDAEPAAKNFLSQYKNLQHHYVHQTASMQAQTFWAGCGAVRKEVFQEVGGFDVKRYARPSIEDIALGHALRSKGYEIRLDPTIQAQHLKRWRFWPLLFTEIFCRAIPWSDLLVAGEHVPQDLNLKQSDRLSAALAWLAVCLIPALFWRPSLGIVMIGVILFFSYLNRGFYAFLLRHRGVWFVARTMPMHFLYYLYGSLSFVFSWLRFRLRRSKEMGTLG